MSEEKTSEREHADAQQGASHATRGWSRRIGLKRHRGAASAQPAAEADRDSTTPQPNTEIEEGEQSISASETIEEELDDAVDPGQSADGAASTPRHRRAFTRAICFGVLPIVALLAAVGAASLKYKDATDAAAERAGVESVEAAKESTIAMLSYTPDTAEASLNAARDRLTGTFRDSYSSLTHDVVIPGAKDQKISATATVPAAATVTASADHAVALVFVNQAIMVDNGAPSQTASVVQVTLDKVGNRWLIAGFDPK